MRILATLLVCLPLALAAQQPTSTKRIPIGGKEKKPKSPDTLFVHIYHTDTLRLTRIDTVVRTDTVYYQQVSVQPTENECRSWLWPFIGGAVVGGTIGRVLPRDRGIDTLIITPTSTTVTPEPNAFVYGLSGLAAVCVLCRLIK